MKKSNYVKTSELEIIKQEIEERIGFKILGKNRSRKDEVVAAQALFVSLARKKTKCSLVTIGAAISRDHSSITHITSKIPDYFERYPYLRRIQDNILGEDIPIHYDELHRELLETRKQLKETDQKFRNAIRGEHKTSHRKLYDLVEQVPDYHVDTVAMRLDPILKMLEKPSRYNDIMNKRNYA